VKEISLDGARVNSLESFWDEVERSLIPGASWGRNLDAFNDILRGGFGTPENGFTLKWEHSAKSKKSLGYRETARQLSLRLARCHPENRGRVAKELSLAERRIGPTVFDWLVEIIKCHGEGGAEAQSNVSLVLS
jgi:RNAse (barnase) inhibitor barstar